MLYNEYDFILSNAEVYNEYDSSQFISNTKTALSNKAEAIDMKMKINHYSRSIQSAINDLNTIRFDKSSIKDFLQRFDKISKLDNLDIKMEPLENSHVDVIRPQYINQFVMIIQKNIDSAIKGELSQNDILPFITGEYVKKVEKQVVKTDLSIQSMNIKEVLKSHDLVSVPINTDYVDKMVLPFLSNYDKKKEMLLNEASSVLHAVQETEATFDAMMVTLDKVKPTLDVDTLKVVNQLSYNSMRNIIDILSYTTYMMIRKLTVFSSNTVTCNKIYTLINNMYSTSMTESVYDQNIFPNYADSITEELMDGKASIFYDISKGIYEYHASLPSSDNIDFNYGNLGDKFHSVIDYEISQEVYDKQVYDDIIGVYMDISAGLNIIAKEGGDLLLVFDDIIKKSGFAMILEDKYQNEIKEIEDLSIYQGTVNLLQNNQVDKHMYKRMLAEMKDYGENMEAIAKSISETKKKILFLANRFSNNVNGEYTDTETVNEIKVFLKSLNEQFDSLTSKVSGGFFARMKQLGKMLNEIEVANNKTVNITNVDGSKPVETDSRLDLSESVEDDFILALYESEYDWNTSSYEDDMRSLQKSYITEREALLHGVDVIFEADDANANQNQQANNQTAQTNTPDTSSGTTPKVTDNSNQNSSNNQTNTTNNNNNTTNTSTDNTDKVHDFIQKIIDTIVKVFDNKKAKNTKWLNENRDELINRNYSNVAVEILPYNNVVMDTFRKDLASLATNISTMDVKKAESIKDNNEAYRILLPFVSPIPVEGGQGEDDSPLKMLNHHYKTGTAPMTKMISVKDSELKNLVTTELVPFCDKCIGTLIDDIKSDVEKIGQAGTDLYNKMGNKDSFKYIKSAYEKCTVAILNAVKDRNNDYLKALSNLVPKTPSQSKTEPVQNGTNENNENDALVNNTGNNNQNTDTSTNA